MEGGMRYPCWPVNESERSPKWRVPLWVFLGLLVVEASPWMRGGQGFGQKELEQIQGDYGVSVYPGPLGYLARDGRLYLIVGGLQSGKGEAALIQEEGGKFVLAPGHPNAFQFTLEGGKVRFTFWSGGQSFAGFRVGEETTAGATEATGAAGTGGAAASAGAATGQPEPPAPSALGKSRAELLGEIEATRTAHEKRPADPEARLAYARLLYQSGDFWRAKDVLGTPLESPVAPIEALSLAADLEYLTGSYGKAERLYRRLADAKAGDPAGRVTAMVKELFTYYQRNQFTRARELNFPEGAVLPQADLMRAFTENPYRLEWSGDGRETIVPFMLTDPLPLLTVEFNGVPVVVIFDTGADMFILDDEIASALGVAKIASAMGKFGGGKEASTSFGKVDRVTLGGVTLHGVPVTILPTKRFSAAFAGGKFTVGGFIGTAALRQFLSTIDYANGRLVLRERTAASSRQIREQLSGRIAGEVPFVLRATHLMMARGRLNDSPDLTLFIDSGLASEGSVTVPIQTLRGLGIPEPVRRNSEESVGGGGGVWASGPFPLRTVALGGLVQSDLKGEYGARPPESYWEAGFIVDGLLSHRFLRQYSSWSIDFDSMVYIFER
jgi:hypothetical protein